MRHKRHCTNCTSSDVGDEFHTLNSINQVIGLIRGIKTNPTIYYAANWTTIQIYYLLLWHCMYQNNSSFHCQINVSYWLTETACIYNNYKNKNVSATASAWIYSHKITKNDKNGIYMCVYCITRYVFTRMSSN